MPLSAVIVKTCVEIAFKLLIIALATTIGFLFSTLQKTLFLVTRSTKVTIAFFLFLPMIVSTSQSPTRSLVSTIFGRSSINIRSLIGLGYTLLSRDHKYGIFAPWLAAYVPRQTPIVQIGLPYHNS